MDTQKELLIKLLTSESSHENFQKVVSKFPLKFINLQIPGVPYTPWHLIEHIRIAQRSNIDYIIDEYKELKWPDDYWPKAGAKATKKMWEKTIQQYSRDIKTLTKIIENPKNDVFSALPHASKYSIFKIVLIIVDHNSYHVGELSLARSILKKKQKQS